MNKGKMNVTSLERSALAHIKGGAVATRNWCNSNVSCAGAGQTTKELIAIQKKGSSTQPVR